MAQQQGQALGIQLLHRTHCGGELGPSQPPRCCIVEVRGRGRGQCSEWKSNCADVATVLNREMAGAACCLQYFSGEQLAAGRPAKA